MVQAAIKKDLEEQDSLLQGIASRIHHRVDLTLQKLSVADNDMAFASSAMRNIMEQQQEYIHFSMLKRALQVYSSHVVCGLANSKTAKKDMKAIRKAHSKAQKLEMPQYTEQLLLVRLYQKDLIPLVHFNESSPYQVTYSDKPGGDTNLHHFS